MAKFNLVTIRPKGFLHSSAFQEVKDSLAWSLTELGHETMLTENTFSSGAQRNIIFGSELIPANQPVPGNSIIYNLEQPSHPGLEQVARLALSQQLSIWDYSPANVQDWERRGIRASHLPIGYTPNLTRIPSAAIKDIDICFLGWITPRRAKLINQLKNTGLNIYCSDCCYGGARDQILSRSKIALNVNHDGRTLFNIVRVSFLLANGKCVISEDSSDMTDYLHLNGALEWRPYDGLVSSIIYLVEHPESRASYESAALDTMEKMDFTASVAHILDSSVSAEPIKLVPTASSSSAIQSRYERGCKAGDMVDFLPWLRSHAQGKMLEIGVRDGASTSAFLLGLEDASDPQGHLTSIDIGDCSKLWQHPQWTFIRANSLTVEFPEASFDVILIDGDHSQAAYRGDLYNAYHWAKPGGLILTHDITPERGHEFYAVGIREEWDKFLRLHPELKHEILPGKYGLGIMEKTQ